MALLGEVVSVGLFNRVRCEYPLPLQAALDSAAARFHAFI
jgi:hypothetical protein